MLPLPARQMAIIMIMGITTHMIMQTNAVAQQPMLQISRSL